MPSHPATKPDPEDRRKHLDFIQAVITRMSASSATTKGWLLPVVTATYGYALTKDEPSIALLGVVAVVMFAIVDANYLNQERAFRRLYDKVAGGGDIPAFSMDPSLAAPEEAPRRSKKRARNSKARASVIPPWAVWSSWAIAPLYGPMLAVGVVIFCLA